MDWETVVEVLVGVLALAAYLAVQAGPEFFARLFKREDSAVAPPEELDYEPIEVGELSPASRQEQPLEQEPDAEERRRLLQQLERLHDEAARLAKSARVTRQTSFLAQTLEDQVVRRARDLVAVLEQQTELTADHVAAVSELELVLAQIEVFVEQRRSPTLAPQLGDADALAMSCYEPVMGFARARGLPLTSARPVTQLGGYDMAIWTGFIPTGLAPIFLPPSFFEQLLWWPAIAHEIGHDFLAAASGVNPGLRQQLGIPDQEEGSYPLFFSGDSLDAEELDRLLGAWFEELFCDMFGTLMLGPAYTFAMVELFSSPDNPPAVAAVGMTEHGTLDPHPPRHLRVLFSARVLDLLGQKDDAERAFEHWNERHGGPPDEIYYPYGESYVGLPADYLQWMVIKLADRLYTEQLDALAGYRLQDIPGVDFGPHENARAERVRQHLKAGKLPSTFRARPVIAGAVLAAIEDPARSARYLTLARRTIPGTGTLEHAPGVHDIKPASPPGQQAEGIPDLRQAFILHTILAPAPSARHARRRGFLERVGR